MPPPPAATVMAFYPQDNNIIVVGKEDSSIEIYNLHTNEVSVRHDSVVLCFGECQNVGKTNSI